MIVFILVVLVFTGVEIFGKLCLLAIDQWPKPSKFAQVLDIFLNVAMMIWAVLILARAAA